uniref:ATP-dependent RNA helicase Ski2/MTR4 C-terminal domain-containing protein n=1 Tax=Chenopodium quinoa TaxID=63459 RepID=A0A803N669_CHEQI
MAAERERLDEKRGPFESKPLAEQVVATVSTERKVEEGLTDEPTAVSFKSAGAPVSVEDELDDYDGGGSVFEGGLGGESGDYSEDFDSKLGYVVGVFAGKLNSGGRFGDYGAGFKGSGQGNSAGESGGGFRGLAGGICNEFEGGRWRRKLSGGSGCSPGGKFERGGAGESGSGGGPGLLGRKGEHGCKATARGGLNREGASFVMGRSGGGLGYLVAGEKDGARCKSSDGRSGVGRGEITGESSPWMVARRGGDFCSGFTGGGCLVGGGLVGGSNGGPGNLAGKVERGGKTAASGGLNREEDGVVSAGPGSGCRLFAGGGLLESGLEYFGGVGELHEWWIFGGFQKHHEKVMKGNLTKSKLSLERKSVIKYVSKGIMVQIDVENFVSSFRPDIMEAVYAWAKGSKFYEIMEITQVFEGSLIRAIRRLEEVLQQLILAAKSIGEIELESKFEDTVSMIKRDIVFAASLYL